MQQYLTPLFGGMLIGLAATIMLLFSGRITGISGILASSFDRDIKANTWRYAFVIGLILGPILMRIYDQNLFSYQIDNSWAQVIVAGLLVGIGTRLGSGCTSGHGICGLPRFSKRSWLATITFMGVAIIVVAIREHLL